MKATHEALVRLKALVCRAVALTLTDQQLWDWEYLVYYTEVFPCIELRLRATQDHLVYERSTVFTAEPFVLATDPYTWVTLRVQQHCKALAQELQKAKEKKNGPETV